MDAVKFIKELRRMCNAHAHCESCPAKNFNCQSLEDVAIVAIVEKWSASHPATTRADLFKKAHPKASTDENGTLVICPKFMDEDLRCPVGVNCWQCRQEYWMQEVE